MNANLLPRRGTPALNRHQRRALAVLTIVSVPLMLSACAGFNRAAVAPDLPALPVYVQEPCKHPLITETDARVIIARYIAAQKACEAKRAGAVAFYDDMAKGLAGK